MSFIEPTWTPLAENLQQEEGADSVLPEQIPQPDDNQEHLLDATSQEPENREKLIYQR